MGVTSLYTAFTCQPLTDGIEPGALDGCTEVTNMEGLFGFTNLQTIPQGLFDNCTEVTNFFGVFYCCSSLTEIPEGLFDKCTEVTSFQSAFASCHGLTSIPIKLFDNNTKVTSFYGAFTYCDKLTGESPYTVINIDGENVKVHLYERANYPEYFTAPTELGRTFEGCEGLTDYGNMPYNWI